MIQRFLAAITVVAMACGIQAQAKLKVYISVDLEGIAGIVADDQTSPNGKDYTWARSMMLGETNAAIAGAFDAGKRILDGVIGRQLSGAPKKGRAGWTSSDSRSKCTSWVSRVSGAGRSLMSRTASSSKAAGRRNGQATRHRERHGAPESRGSPT